MLGSLRLLLALAVALSHVDYQLFGLNPGVSAVVGFYLISGYVMTGLLQRHYPGRAPAFYLDRALRLLPQYFFYAALTLLWYRFSPALPANPSVDYFLQHPPAWVDYLNNLIVIPLNYYMWNDSVHFTLIPPAWSLGAEIQFYLLAPLILCLPRRLLAGLLLALPVLALALLGQINSDWFGYRLLPGVLVWFFLGGLLYHAHRLQAQRPQQGRALIVLALTFAALAAFLAWRSHSLAQPFNREVLLGLVLVLPLLHLLARRPRRRWDELAGDISYGVFLNHFLIYWLFFPAGVAPAQLPLFLLLSVFSAWCSQRWIERPCLRWRQKLRLQP